MAAGGPVGSLLRSLGPRLTPHQPVLPTSPTRAGDAGVRCR
ncbi:MAG: hypothetical protein AVDCRST_MAG48-2518 [uncultured Friedmanniella sp.]|uniref:Uncharacterized protein n=1 Tax=uncultured Friedmanniella sp. TaxID=335381 RepID=A0A6J4KYH9_9ACTN|nr:MAG: hypothetical protein AVDCRST_MAG48-2518 [uncultured Friedmanniella sp.]